MTRDDILPMWTIYNSPRDFPGVFVVRRHEVSGGDSRATEEHATAPTLKLAREAAMRMGGSMPLARSDSDDPCIVETWL